MRSIGNHFVHIHIGLGPRTRLPDDQWKLLIPFAGYDFFACRSYQIALLCIQPSQFGVGQSRRLFQIGKGPDHFHGHRCLGANFEVVARTLSLRTPEGFFWHLDFANGVLFNAK